ncbi:MAG: hypothetical protein QM820_57105 [Minicystis sp.]
MAGSLVIVSSLAACKAPADPADIGSADDAAVRASRTNHPDDQGHDDDGMGKPGEVEEVSSPYVVGVWKFIPNAACPDKPEADTEFRFINPTDTTFNIEYAFFELDGTFCGCDRDTIDPNATVVYTILGESRAPTPVPIPGISKLFSCTGRSGALKSIFFRNVGQNIFLDGAEQVGFQTHGFGGVTEFGESPEFDFIEAPVMTESPLMPVTINATTLEEIRELHALCNSVQGPL